VTDGGYEALSCRQEGCSFAETGTCMEGLAPAACPHLGTLRADEGIERLPSDRGAASEAGGRHFFGGVVPFESAHEIAAAHDTKLVVLLGEKDSGKTTLLAELHQLFLEGPVGDMMFAGSMTLPEFEDDASSPGSPLAQRMVTRSGQSLQEMTSISFICVWRRQSRVWSTTIS